MSTAATTPAKKRIGFLNSHAPTRAKAMITIAATIPHEPFIPPVIAEYAVLRAFAPVVVPPVVKAMVLAGDSNNKPIILTIKYGSILIETDRIFFIFLTSFRCF
jgi:hypothetical protein